MASIVVVFCFLFKSLWWKFCLELSSELFWLSNCDDLTTRQDVIVKIIMMIDDIDINTDMSKVWQSDYDDDLPTRQDWIPSSISWAA